MSVFFFLSFGIIAASIFGLAARVLKQPLLIGYLFAGLVLAFVGFLSQEHHSLLEGMSQFGITFLLFLVGLEMNIKEISAIGKPALFTGLGQIVFTSAVGYLIALTLGYNHVTSLYIAVALTFSSTIIIVKLLSEKKDLASLYGKIAVGFLLVQDLVAVLILMFLSGFQTETFSTLTFFWILVKGVLILAVVYLASKTVLVKFFDKVAAVSSELLFITSIAWALTVAALVSLPQVGFSIEIGGFLAGLALAHSSEHLQIASRVRPLRDFFITIFFLLLGAKLLVSVGPEVILPAAIFSLFILVGNPLIVMAIMGLLGYKKRTSFLASVTVAQISEFSLILIFLGEKIGHVSTSVVGMVTVVGVVTMSLSTYLILYANGLYTRLRPLLGIFEKEKVQEDALAINKSFTNHTVLLGCDRLGKRILRLLEKKGGEVVVIDFNPRVVETLAAENHQAFYGDVADIETLEALGLGEAKLIVSTTGSIEDNLVILEYLAKLPKRPLSIYTASTSREALELYEKGADYVIVPQVAAGDHLAHLLSVHSVSRAHFKTLRDRHFERLAKDRF